MIFKVIYDPHTFENFRFLINTILYFNLFQNISHSVHMLALVQFPLNVLRPIHCNNPLYVALSRSYEVTHQKRNEFWRMFFPLFTANVAE